MKRNLIFMSKCGKDLPNGYKGAFKEYGENATIKKSFTLNGNFPKLFPSMCLSVEMDESDKIVTYDIQPSPKNISILEKNGLDPNKYFDDIELHKKTKLLWKDIDKVHTPYDNFDFETAELYAKLDGKDMKAPDRMEALVKETINRFRKSRKESYDISAYIDTFRKTEDKGQFGHLSLDDVIGLLNDKRFKVEDCMIKDKELIEAHKFNRESVLNRKRNKQDFLPFEEIEEKLNEEKYCKFSEEQKRAILELSNTAPTVLTGGAGSGKTSVIKGLLDMLDEFGIYDYLLLAPTGRASQRMRETTGKEAYTIHHALGIAEDNGYKRYDENHQLEYSVIITDEGSMIDDLLMCDLLKAAPDNTKLFFVGDKNQLFPVGCGEPFCDFINDCLCHGITLSKNFRQANENGIGIYRNAERILNNEDIKADTGVNIQFIKETEIADFASKTPDGKTQNISPYNKVNDIINEAATVHKKNGKEFFSFEKVVAIKNTKNYNNGDIGNIVEVHADGSLEIRFTQREIVSVPKEELNNIKPAYSLTVHKCQGSEFEKVNLFIPIKMNKFITKRLLYTAVTRAKENLNIYFYK